MRAALGFEGNLFRKIIYNVFVAFVSVFVVTQSENFPFSNGNGRGEFNASKFSNIKSTLGEYLYIKNTRTNIVIF